MAWIASRFARRDVRRANTRLCHLREGAPTSELFTVRELQPAEARSVGGGSRPQGLVAERPLTLPDEASATAERTSCATAKWHHDLVHRAVASLEDDRTRPRGRHRRDTGPRPRRRKTRSRLPRWSASSCTTRSRHSRSKHAPWAANRRRRSAGDPGCSLDRRAHRASGRRSAASAALAPTTSCSRRCAARFPSARSPRCRASPR